MFAPRRFSSATCRNRPGNTRSSTRLAPSLTAANAVHWACRSVGMPGYGSATMSTARKRAAGRDRHPIGADLDLGARLAKFGQHRAEMFRHHADDRGRAAGDGRRDQQRGGLDAVGNEPVRCAAELIDALDVDRGRSQPLDARPQRDEESAEIDDLRLDGRAADRGRAAGKHGGAHHVGGAGHRGTVGAGKVDARRRSIAGRRPRRSRVPGGCRPPAPPVLSGADRPAGFRCCIRRAAARRPGRAGPAAARARRIPPASAAPILPSPEPARDRSSRAARWGRHSCLSRGQTFLSANGAVTSAVTGRQECLPHRVHVCHFLQRHAHSQAAQQLGLGPHVGQPRHAVQSHRLAGQDRRGHDRQRGVLRPARADRAVQCNAAGDLEMRHEAIHWRLFSSQRRQSLTSATSIGVSRALLAISFDLSRVFLR